MGNSGLRLALSIGREGGNVKKFGASAAVILGLAGAASMTDASADDSMATKAAPAVTAKAVPQPATCGSPW